MLFLRAERRYRVNPITPHSLLRGMFETMLFVRAPRVGGVGVVGLTFNRIPRTAASASGDGMHQPVA